MGVVEVARLVQAPIERVFDTIAKIENFQKVVPEIVGVEFLSAQRHGVGTRIKETRRMGRREATVELEVTEYVDNEHIRVVSDAGGTIWDTTFRVRPASDGKVELSMVMQDKAYKLVSRLMNPLIRPMIRKAVARDLDAVKAFCERG